MEEAFTKEGEPYLRLILGDKSGFMPANLWSNILEECSGPFQAGDYFGPLGQVKAFRGALEVQRILTTDQILAIKGELKYFHASLLHAVSEYDPEQMWQELLALVNEVLTPPLDLVLNLLHRQAEVWQTPGRQVLSCLFGRITGAYVVCNQAGLADRTVVSGYQPAIGSCGSRPP